MGPFEGVVRTRDAAGLRTWLTTHPELRAEIDRPMFDTEPAVVFCRRDRAMVDVLLEFGADGTPPRVESASHSRRADVSSRRTTALHRSHTP